MLRAEVFSSWNALKTKLANFHGQLQAQSITNYPIITKRTILGLDNVRSPTSKKLCDLTIASGVPHSQRTNRRSNNLVEIQTELLKVAIIEDLTATLAEEATYLRNYEGEIDPADDNGPVIAEVSD
jgi:hypothetical protein